MILPMWLMRHNLAVLLSLLLFSSCNALTGESWKEADDFVAQLRCGMSLQEIEELATRHADAKVIRQRGPSWPNYLVTKKNTTISLLLAGGGLELISHSEITGVKEVRVTPRHNLCTGEATVELSIIAPEGMEGAGIYLDDARIGQVPPSRITSIRVPLGQHEIQVKHPNGPFAVNRLDLDEQSSGRQRWEIDNVREADAGG